MEFDSLSTIIALTLGVGWASGINLSAAVLALGLAGSTGYADLPTDLELVVAEDLACDSIYFQEDWCFIWPCDARAA